MKMQTDTGKKPGDGSYVWGPVSGDARGANMKAGNPGANCDVNKTTKAVFEDASSEGEYSGTVSEPEMTGEQVNKQKKRGRGRPLGSKNKTNKQQVKKDKKDVKENNMRNYLVPQSKTSSVPVCSEEVGNLAPNCRR